MINEILKRGQYTNQEGAVVKYILENPETILHYSAKDLAKQAFVSAATISRLVKKMGFNSYIDFQLMYAKEYKHIQNDTLNTLSKNSSLMELTNNLSQVYSLIIDETKKIFNDQTFSRIINYALHADTIDFYANDINYQLIRDTSLKLNSLDFHAQAFNTIFDHYVSTINPQKAVSFIVSHTGSNQPMIDNALYLKNRGIRVVAITRFPASKLETVCHDTLYIDTHPYNLPKELQLYGISIGFLLDLLVAALAIKKQ